MRTSCHRFIHFLASDLDSISLSQTQQAVRSALCDSFNTPDALDKILELISKTNVYLARGRSAVNVSVIEMVANWTTKILRVFGLGEGATTRGTIGWGEVEKDGESVVDVGPF